MAASKRRVLVTGVARWWGALLVQRLVEDRRVDEVVAIDTEEPHHDLGDADFLKLDVRHSLVGKLVRAVGIDTVVHTQTLVDSIADDPRAAHETNVIGTLNLLAGLAGDDSPVRRVVMKSSAHVYGSRHDLPGHLREQQQLDTASAHSFVRDMIEAETSLAEFAIRNPEVETVALRFANSLNPEEPAPLARYFDLPLVPTVAGFDPVLQLIHRDDCVEAMVRATVGGQRGAYNIAADDPRPLSALLDRAGKLHAPLLPPAGALITSTLLARAGIASLSPQLVDLLRWGRTMDLSRARRQLGFAAGRDTPGALDEYIQQRRVLQFLPKHGQYTYERELEEYIHRRRARREQAATLRLATEGEPGMAPAKAPSAPPRRLRRSPQPHRS